MSKESIIVSARVAFAAVGHIAERLSGVDFPIELALPYQYDWWKDAVLEFDEMLTALKKAKVIIATVHATQAKISEQDFLKWGQKTIKIAECIGAKTITVHPNEVKKDRSNLQELALTYLRQLQRSTSVVISVETFTGKRRIFRPEEIMDAKLPMTLDTAHIHDDERIIDVIDNYWQKIPVVHLSARGLKEQHLPVDSFCIQVVRRLVNLGWSGTITLEYLPWHHYRLRSDIKLVQQALLQDINPEQILPPCDTYKKQSGMWGHDAPGPNAAAWNSLDHNIEIQLKEIYKAE